jgi:hypothetical protein
MHEEIQSRLNSGSALILFSFESFVSPFAIRKLKSEQVEVRRHTHTGFWWGNFKKGDYLEDLGINGRIPLKWTLKKAGGIVRFGLDSSASDDGHV